MKFENLPFDQAIEFKSGNASRKLAVFSDPDCPYCQQLELELARLDDVTIYIFPFPLTQLHPNAATIAHKIWCASDRATAWHDYLIQKTEPNNAGDCENPIEDNIKLGQSLNVQGTPTLILSNGELITGIGSAEGIEAALSDVHSSVMQK